MTSHLLQLDSDALAAPLTHVPAPPVAYVPTATSTTPRTVFAVPPRAAPFSAPSRAATLLSAAGDTASGNAARLSIGLGGIALLGVLGPSAVFLANLNLPNGGILDWLRLCVLQMLTFTAVAALALTMALPGLWILLAIFAIPIEVPKMINAVSRAALRAGLFCLGFAPCILLYTATGGDTTMSMVCGSLCYQIAGALGLFSLGLDLSRALTTRITLGRALLVAWLCLSSVLGCYLFMKMQIWILFHEGSSW